MSAHTEAHLEHAARFDLSWELVAMSNQVLELTKIEDTETIVGAALAEAALGHMRGLIEFLTFGPKTDDMRAKDFGGRAQQPMPDLYKGITRHLSHLAWARVSDPPSTVRLLLAARTILKAFITFTGQLSPDRQLWFE